MELQTILKKIRKPCAECGEECSGRADKKFCSDSCRNSYHNKLKDDGSNYIRTVNYSLRKNRRILMELLMNQETMRCLRSKLLDLGFEPGLFTSIYTNRRGETYFYSYDFGYLALENDYFCLVRKKAYT